MMHIIITSYREPDSTIKAINSFLKQRIKEKFKITVIDPFPETEKIIKKKFKSKKVEFFLDPGEGKSYALNIFLEKIYSKNTDEIIIFTDGDVYVGKNSIKEILKAFKDKKTGCVTGKPVSLDSKNNIFGFWSHLLFAGIDKAREKLSKQGKFFECSGYLFAIRNGVLQGFPLEASEDSIIPFLFRKKDYKIRYAQKAEVYVHNPKTWKKWIKQKIRNIKGHENLNKIAPNMPRTKSFWNEIKEGTFFALKYPKNLKEFSWIFLLFVARFHIYIKAFYDIRIKKKGYKDAFRAKYY